MEFTLLKKKVVVKGKDNEPVKEFINFYLKNGDVIIPISVRVFKDSDGFILNKTDFVLACKLAESIN